MNKDELYKITLKTITQKIVEHARLGEYKVRTVLSPDLANDVRKLGVEVQPILGTGGYYEITWGFKG